MMWMKGKRINRHDYNVFHVVTTEFQYHDNRAAFYQIEAPNWVNVIAICNQHIIMVKQYRIGSEAYSLELPGGIIETQHIDVAGVKELEEETGYTGEAKLIGHMSPNPALFTNQLYTLFVAHAVQANKMAPELFEDIEVIHVPIEEIHKKIAHGEITNALTIASFMQLNARYPHFFNRCNHK